MEVDDDFLWQILLGDEVHCHLDSSVNTQIASEQPHTGQETPMHSQSHCLVRLHSHSSFLRLLPQQDQAPWQPSSPNLTPCDFWLWVYLKSKIYAGVANLIFSKANISQAVQNIPRDTLRMALKNVVQRTYSKV
ncbi:hypothetical protein TNCV_697531 [Trichonephila clavipes]|nr:hypothetical protein TNCV_697531 [Trichonephila clavipes]